MEIQKDQQIISFFSLLQRYFKTKNTLDRLKDCDNNPLLKEHAIFMREFLNSVEEEAVNRLDQAIEYVRSA